MKRVLAIAGIAVMGLAIISIWQRWQNPSQETPIRAEGSRLATEITSDTWLNSAPLTTEDLRGKVVLVEFWTFDCINCRNTIPYIRAIYQKYHAQGLVVIGVHTPELSFERELTNVKTAIHDQNIPYPVAIDNDSKNWNAFNVWAWPTWFIFQFGSNTPRLAAFPISYLGFRYRAACRASNSFSTNTARFALHM